MLQQATAIITVSARLSLILKNKISVDLSALPIAWEAEVNYRFELTENFVRDINGNQQPIPLLANLKTIYSGPIRSNVTSNFLIDFEIIRVRTSLVTYNSQFNNTITGRGIFRTTTNLPSSLSTSINNFTEYFFANIQTGDVLDGLNLFRIINDQIVYIPHTEWVNDNEPFENVLRIKNIFIRKTSTNLIAFGINFNPNTSTGRDETTIVEYKRNNDKPTFLRKSYNTINGLSVSDSWDSQIAAISNDDNYLAFIEWRRIDYDQGIYYSTQRPRLTLLKNPYGSRSQIPYDIFGVDVGEETSFYDMSWDSSNTYLAISYRLYTVAAPTTRITNFKVYKRVGDELTEIYQDQPRPLDANSTNDTFPFITQTPNGQFLYSTGRNQNSTTNTITIFERTNDNYAYKNIFTINFGNTSEKILSLKCSNNGNFMAVTTFSKIYILTISQGDLSLLTTINITGGIQGSLYNPITWSTNDNYLVIGTRVSGSNNPLKIYKRSNNTFTLISSITGLTWPNTGLGNEIRSLGYSQV